MSTPNSNTPPGPNTPANSDPSVHGTPPNGGSAADPSALPNSAAASDPRGPGKPTNAGAAPNLRQAGIAPDVVFGEKVTVIQPVNLYGCAIGDNSFVGPFVEIQRKVTVGKFCRIQSHTFICELVEIGEHCFIGHGVMFINDLFSDGGPAGGDVTKWKSTHIGNHVSIGSNATILPVSICDNVVIGAGAVVTKNITKPGIYAGNPARLLKAIEK